MPNDLSLEEITKDHFLIRNLCKFINNIDETSLTDKDITKLIHADEIFFNIFEKYIDVTVSKKELLDKKEAILTLLYENNDNLKHKLEYPKKNAAKPYYNKLRQFFEDGEKDEQGFNKFSLASLILTGNYINEQGKQIVKIKDMISEIKKYYRGNSLYSEKEMKDYASLEKIIGSDDYIEAYGIENVNELNKYLAPFQGPKIAKFFKQFF